MRYKESITKSTRGWGERLFSRNSAVPNLTYELRRQSNTQIDTGSGMVNHLATRDSIGSAFSSPVAVNSAAISNNEGVTGNHVVSLPTDTSAPCLPASIAN
ncbi:E3 ubiquitin-protein ligase RHF2A-like [Zingiber officinale]|nr:E3 ubiquitin-protein ligase RHF2A-like [Zingiber officinale]